MKKQGNKRNKRLTIRLTYHEKYLIYKNAKASKMKPSRYLRYCLFNNSKIVTPQEATRKMKVATLNDKLQPLEAKYKGVGHNLNQVVKETHIYGLDTKVTPLTLEIQATRKTLKDLDHDVQKLKF